MSRIGVGIIGLSAGAGWAARSHLPALRALGDRFAITAVAGSSPERSRAAASDYAIPFAADSADALAAHADVDLVVVAVKVPEHRRLVEAALAAGKAVLCEWPLAVDAAEADRLARAAADARIKTFVGLQARGTAAVQRLAQLIADGAIGDILASNISAAVGVPWAGVTDSSRTYLNRTASGATMLTIPFGHCLDAMTLVLGDYARSSAELVTRRTETLVKDEGVMIPTDVADQIMVAGRLASGAAASLHYRGGLSAAGNFRWEINGTKGDILVTGGDGHLQYGLVEIALAKTGKALAPLALPADPLPPHARAIAAQYRAIHAALAGAPSTVPDFAHAAALHHKLGAIAAKGTAS
ncbi:Gfo/Idh/MocA family protein [Sphingopyxis sp. NFH-91]|uniref:Gfo/Idh/MocA family protein n=1 Tax=Sphingopyxis sp. NFH-91 TaxID=2744457 RepID=UPI001F43F2EC|nr:Gfo/Idh/MocA family oxidoreductase [Sphingopyxis sp. NFH-91]